MQTSVPDYDSLRSGIRSISMSITILLAAISVGTLSALSLFSRMGGLAGTGFFLFKILLVTWAVLNVWGKTACWNTPAGKEFLFYSLLFDAGAFGAGLTPWVSLRGWLSVLAGGLFLGYLLKLGAFLGSQKVTDVVLSTLKKYSLFAGLGLAGEVLSFFWAGVGQIFLFTALMVSVWAFFGYLRSLGYTAEALIEAKEAAKSSSDTNAQ